MSRVSSLFEFIRSAPTAYQTVLGVKSRLLSAGYTELSEGERWNLSDGGKYFTTRNGSSLIAFRYRADAAGFAITASHSDQPSFRVKRSAETGGEYVQIGVEKYGGMIYYTWFDRPLSVAGRLLCRTEKGLTVKYVNLDRDLAVIPSVAIHMNRAVNDGYKFNPAVDLLPLCSLTKGSLMAQVAAAAGVTEEEIVSHDLFLYNRDEGRTFGTNGEFILCPRLDDLGCVYACLCGFLDARGAASSLPVLAVFDNEEVGSETRQGAASTFLADTLRRIAGGRYDAMLSQSFSVSADNAHAKHPNHPELADRDNAPLLGGGLVIKFNASQRYATDGVSDAVFRTVCARAGVPVQTYYNRADMPGGSTLGSISDTKVSVPTVDIGLPQLAMHSANETAATADVEGMISALAEFYSTSFSMRGEEILF